MSTRSPIKTKARWAHGLMVALLGGLLLASPSADAGGDAQIVVPVSTVRNSNGTVFIALYDKAHWLEPGRYVVARKVPAQGGTVFHRFKNLPRGRYGVAVWHDENANNRVDTNLLGLPNEGYGFSRVTPRRKPNFDDVAITASPQAYAPIQLRY